MAFWKTNSKNESKDKRVLIVDDDKLIISLIEKALNLQKSFKVDQVSCAESGLAACLLNQYDLIISDFYMPAMNGDVFLKKLRAADGSPSQNSPVIIQSSAHEVIQKLSQSKDIIAVLQKPIQLPELIDRLKTLGLIPNQSATG